ncbi:hypothetical protein B7486_69455, partial [cyanobacterium TDX16]
MEHRMQPKHLAAALAALLATVATLVALSPSAGAETLCTPFQMTTTSGAGATGLGGSATGTSGEAVAFLSDRNQNGGNPDLNLEVWLAEPGAVPRAITSTTGPGNDVPAISGDGDLVAWPATHDFGGQNPDGNAEVWMWQRATNTITAVTISSGGSSSSAGDVDVSRDGTTIVFASNRDLVGTNADL